MIKLKITPVGSESFEVTGNNYWYDDLNDIHFLGDASYPGSIVEIMDEE